MVNKCEIKIPKGTRYLSEVPGFKLPEGIVDKELTGCGATTLALKDGTPTILASPRRALVLNKAGQFPPPGSLAVLQGVYKDSVREYLDQCHKEGTVPKIITTYDSLGKVSACLSKEELGSFRLVVDEFHNILNDSTFKATVELAFLKEYRKYSHVTYLSATPMLEKYIDNIEYFSGMAYTVLKWNEDDILEFRLYDNPAPNPLNALCEIIKAYKKDGYMDFDGVRSYEAVIFLNSVKNILNVIGTCNLTPEECNIIISNTKDNKSILDAFGIDRSYNYNIGCVPLKKEDNKMFTFCTSTAYQGCDFHSDSAMTFIISDSNIPNTVVDIFTELPQIIGRQRDDENPFRNKAAFYYRTSAFHANEAVMQQDLDGLDRMTREVIGSINSIPSIELRDNLGRNYCNGLTVTGEQGAFVYYDEDEHKMVMNIMARNGYVWRCDVKRMYKDKDRVNELLVKLHKVNTEGSLTTGNTEGKLSVFTNTVFTEAMKEYCELRERLSQTTDGGAVNAAIRSKLRDSLEGSNIWKRCELYYDTLGPEKIKALSYQESRIRNEAHKAADQQKIQAQIDAHYTDGQRIEKVRLKGQMQSIYDSLGLKVKAKATDIEDYGFRCEECKFTIESKRVHGFILKKTS